VATLTVNSARSRGSRTAGGIRSVFVRNYKSIAQSAVKLEPFTVLVGANGAGKSNFIDALSFVRDCLADSVELAFRNRGGIGAVRRRSGGHPTHIGIRLQIELSGASYADYSFEISAKPPEKFSIARESCSVGHGLGETQSFEVRSGTFVREIAGIRPRMATDRLALFAASATEEFRPVYDFLTSMRFYSIVPVRLREVQEPDAGEYLRRDGSNAAAVLKRLLDDSQQSDRYDRICRLLARIVPGVASVGYMPVGQMETLEFKQDVGRKHPWSFQALSMSDGTLRALGVLLAVYQPGYSSVVGIEEPEATVHPAVTEVLTQVMMDAALERQILLTTHSPDILDYKELEDTAIRVVTSDRGKTEISMLADPSRDAIRKVLYTPGELLRADELNPDIQAARRYAEQMSLFGPDSPAAGG